MNKNIVRNHPEVFLFSIIVILYLINYVPVLGYWEVSTVYYEINNFFDHRFRDYRWIIQEGANVAGQYGNHGYPLLKIFNPFIKFFNLNYSIFLVHFIPKIYSLVALFFFWKLIKRFTNNFVSIITTMLLSINIVFVLMSNQLLPLTITFMSLVITLYFFETIVFAENISKSRFIALGFSYSLLALHYSMGRFSLVFLLCWQFFVSIYRKDRFKLKGFFVSLLSMIAFLVIYYPRNFKYLFSSEFLFPRYAEVAKSNIFQMIIFNIKEFVTTFVTWSGFTEIERLIVLCGEPGHFIDFPVFILSLAGLIVFCKKYNGVKLLFYISLIGLLFSLPLLSDLRPDKLRTTMSIFRMFLNLFSIYFLLSFFLQFLYEKSKKIIIIIALLFISFELFVFADLYRNIQKSVNRISIDFTKKWDKNIISSLPATEIQLYVREFAKFISINISEKDSILYLDEEKYTPRFYYSHGMDDPPQPFLKVLLFLYLEDIGLKTTYYISDKGWRGKDIDQFKGLVLATNSIELDKAKMLFKEKKIFSINTDGKFIQAHQ